MNGVEEYKNRLEGMARRRIEKSENREMLEGFYDYLLTTKTYSTAYFQVSIIDEFLSETKKKDAAKIKLNDYTRYLNIKKKYTTGYQINVYAALKNFNKYLVANEICKTNFMSFVDRPKFTETQETKERREKGFLNKSEIKTIIDSVSEDGWTGARNKAILLIFLNTGIRLSALYKLDISDVDLEEKTITVLEKGNLSRKLYISDVTVDAIREWLNYRKVNMTLDYTNALFLSTRYTRMSSQAVYKIIKTAGESIDGKGISPHKLRATFGTQLYEATQNVYFVQHRMGHASPQTTELYIRGQKEEEARKAADLMGDLLQ